MSKKWRPFTVSNFNSASSFVKKIIISKNVRSLWCSNFYSFQCFFYGAFVRVFIWKWKFLCERWFFLPDASRSVTLYLHKRQRLHHCPSGDVGIFKSNSSVDERKAKAKGEFYQSFLKVTSSCTGFFIPVYDIFAKITNHKEKNTVSKLKKQQNNDSFLFVFIFVQILLYKILRVQKCICKLHFTSLFKNQIKLNVSNRSPSGDSSVPILLSRK